MLFLNLQLFGISELFRIFIILNQFKLSASRILSWYLSVLIRHSSISLPSLIFIFNYFKLLRFHRNLIFFNLSFIPLIFDLNFLLYFTFSSVPNQLDCVVFLFLLISPFFLQAVSMDSVSSFFNLHLFFILKLFSINKISVYFNFFSRSMYFLRTNNTL